MSTPASSHDSPEVEEDHEDTPRRAEAPGRWLRFGRFLREVFLVAFIALLTSAVVRAYVGQVFVIPSESMTDTVHVKDRLVGMKFKDAQRGDIIVFEDPGGWLNEAPPQPTGWRKTLQPLGRGAELVGLRPSSSTHHLLKRLIGMPGDVVECCDNQGRLMVNGQPLDEPYLREGLPAASVPFKVVVPEGRVFVMGDNRNASRDSRCHLATITNDGEPRGMRAFVPLENVVGPAELRIAPLDRFGRMTRPDTFALVPAPKEPAPKKPVIEPAGVSC